MPPKKGKKGKKAEEEPESTSEYATMDLEMLREVVPMLRQQLDKSMLDRNYVQLERVSSGIIPSMREEYMCERKRPAKEAWGDTVLILWGAQSYASAVRDLIHGMLVGDAFLCFFDSRHQKCVSY